MMADESNPLEVGASIPGTVAKINVAVGDEVKESQPLLVLEAMKMETNIISPMDGIVEHIYVKEGEVVESGQLVLELKEKESSAKFTRKSSDTIRYRCFFVASMLLLPWAL